VRVLPVRKVRKNNGFSLTEVLFAVATLAIGMLFIAGTFPVAIYFSTIATERTIAAVAADEAFAKVRLYAIGSPNDLTDGLDFSKLGIGQLTDFNSVVSIDPIEFAYPSTGPDISGKKYFWSALCRLVDPNTQLVQVTVFVSRKIGEGGGYRVRNPDGSLNPVGSFYPIPIAVGVSQAGPDANELSINFVDPVEKTFINDGYTIVDDQTGQIYRVLERYAGAPPIDQVIKLDRPWRGGPGSVWVVPPPVNGGRYPCIAVYQKVIRF